MYKFPYIVQLLIFIVIIGSVVVIDNVNFFKLTYEN